MFRVLGMYNFGLQTDLSLRSALRKKPKNDHVLNGTTPEIQYRKWGPKANKRLKKFSFTALTKSRYFSVLFISGYCHLLRAGIIIEKYAYYNLLVD